MLRTPKKHLRTGALLMALSGPALAEPALGILTSAGHAQIKRRSDSSILTAVEGDLLFEGDSLLIPSGVTGSAEFRFCSSSTTSKTFRLATGRAQLQRAEVEGAVEVPGAGAACMLPDVEQDPAIGMMTERALSAGRQVPVAASDLARMSVADREKFEALDAASKRAPRDLTSRVSRAALLQRNGIDEAAAAAYLAIGNDWPEQQWARSLGYSIATRKAPASQGTGKLYAAFIGISQYEKPNIPALKYADADAILFSSFMQKTRAQAFSGDRLFLSLINENARVSSVRTKLKRFFDQAQRSDSVLLYIAAHGVGATDSDNGYVVLYDTPLESKYDNSLSMEWIRELLLAEAAKVHHVFLFVDTCHANRIGPIRAFGSSDSAVASAAKVVTDGKVLAMYASGANQVSFENKRYGGGHGAFTYFLMRALNITSADPDYGKADVNKDGDIDSDELVSYVEDSVKADTHLKQSPKDDVRIDRFAVSTKLAGLAIAPCCGTGGTAAAANILRDPTMGASDARSLEWNPPPEVEEISAWEEKSQQVLYKYLQGEEIPQTEADYVTGLDATERARNLAGESLYLDARAEFFRGRLLLFRKGNAYAEAVSHLEKAIRMDPASPYAYNALGIAWLEQGRYAQAEAAFQDASKRAVNWAYPRHNLGLLYLQRGDYRRAIATYREAERLAPQYSYLPYNLGLIYQRLNETDAAVREYVLAQKNAPNRAAPLVALGALMAERGRNGKARDYYGQARELLQTNLEPEVLLNLRHNEGLLEARSRNHLDQAVTLWRANIDAADYLPSRFALARALTAAADSRHPSALGQALAEYSQIVAKVPENTGARIEYAAALYQAHQTGEAIQVVQNGLQTAPADSSLLTALRRLQSGRAPQ